MRWITRERPKIDRVACPWLISRFIDTEAEFIFVPPDQVIEEAQKLDATPYDVHDVELTHDGELCSFDAASKEVQIGRTRTELSRVDRPRSGHRPTRSHDRKRRLIRHLLGYF
jgi:hypothetical protein